MKRYDAAGQRLTDCCAAYATYGPDVTLANLDTVPLRCAECGRLTADGEGDGTEHCFPTREEPEVRELFEKFQDDFFAALGEDDPIGGADS